MGRHLLKAPNGVIVEWSSVVDAPVAAFKDEDAARTITVTEAGIQARNDAHRGWEARARRLRERGTTMMDGDDGWESCVGCNRAGPREAELGEADLLALVTKMAEENEAGSAAWLAQNDVEHAVKAERTRVVALLREKAGRYDQLAETDRVVNVLGHIAARDALVEMAARVEAGDG
jgi:hypothetical protein